MKKIIIMAALIALGVGTSAVAEPRTFFSQLTCNNMAKRVWQWAKQLYKMLEPKLYTQLI